MTITINGEAQDVSADTLANLLVVLGLGDAVVATALNGAFVARGQRIRTTISPGDRVEIVAPMQGG